MKSEKKILIAFILNLSFAVFEFIGGIFTGSVAIMSDSVHDIGDAASIGVSYLLERKSKKEPDETHTYGYARYSVIGSLISTLILLVGSAAVIYNAVLRIINPTHIDYDGMIVFAVVGVAINFLAVLFTRGGDSLNQRAVNLHMLEDVLGWAVVLIGAIVMRFTDFALLDPLMSIGVAVFILVHAILHLKEALDLFVERTPRGVSIAALKEHIMGIDGIVDVHHIHVWSIDGQSHYATMHIITDSDARAIKQQVRDELKKHRIIHATLELETTDEHCHDENCHLDVVCSSNHHHHHH